MTEKKAYTDAYRTGRYEKVTGLEGKYDNVRRFWEDDITRIFLRPFLRKMVERKQGRLERLRILDLGCGSGDGYELLMDVTDRDPGIYEHQVNVISPEILSLYVGIDINPSLLRQAEDIFSGNDKMVFMQEDFSKGLPVKDSEPPFDIYFTSYGTLAHNKDEMTINILADIAQHVKDYGLIICDWLGRYSYEWQDLWEAPAQEETFMDYKISYIFPEEERNNSEIDSFPLRLLCKDEVMKIVKEASRKAGVKITTGVLFDRSIFVGRHMDTCDYNCNCPKMRRAVSSLFEWNLRTDLQTLLLDYIPKQGFDQLNSFFETYSLSWNALIKYAIQLLSNYDGKTQKVKDAPKVPSYYPDFLKELLAILYQVIEGAGSVPWGDPRANIIEPILGYALRSLEMNMQSGYGYGHGLVGVFEVKK
jgi:SAM-dependent methyltransferase